MPLKSSIKKHIRSAKYAKVGLCLFVAFSQTLMAALDQVAIYNSNLQGDRRLAGNNEQPFLIYLEETRKVESAKAAFKGWEEDLTQEQKNIILDDEENRIASEFAIPDRLRKRVEFWFDIYTKYTSEQQVIHHAMYPWIVFKVVDSSDIGGSKTNKWTKYHRAQKRVREETAKIRTTLLKLSKKKNFNKLNSAEAEIYSSLFVIEGKRQKVFREAYANVRSQLGQKDFFSEGLKVSSKYLPHMEEIFLERDLPPELTRLPFVESSFNVKAQSKVGASGVWQIMPYIGKHFAIVNHQIDERNNPIKATEMAAKVLRQNITIFKQWPLAVTAYNHGAGGLLKGMKKTRSNDLPTIINKYKAKAFGFASSNFFCSFLAALHAEKYHNEIFGPLYKEDLHKSDVFQLSKSMRVSRILQITGLDKETLKSYNLDMKKTVSQKTMLPRGYRIHLPVGYKTRLVDLLETQRDPIPGRKIGKNRGGQKIY